MVLTTRDRADRLAATLEDFARLRSEGFDWELLIVDNGSRDATAAVIAEASKCLPIRMLTLDRPGKCRAQNLALEQVVGALVVFTDDDVSVDSGWLEALWGAAQRWPDADLFGGAIRVKLIGDPPDWLQGENGQKIVARHCAEYRPREDEGYTDTPPIGPNMAVRRRVLGDIRFDENVGPDGSSDYIKGGDTDFNIALMQRGHRCVFVPNAIVGHHAYAEQLSFESLFQGVYRRGRKNGYLRPERGGPSISGVPIKLWVRLIKQWLRLRCASRTDALVYYELGTKYFYRLGYVDQLRVKG
ncbi:glycosyltransferase family 2 protein [Salinisphaera sp. C84B14]|uniref:glycosyltransferase n=1 Tax=Salinisphaera sp. C84B14 TaxID=1304155 RepID=UPI0033418580